MVFHPLGEKHIASIAQIQLQRLYKRLEERGYEVHMSDEALKLLSANGYDPVYGARPLKRAIQQQIENPLAQQILSGELIPGKEVQLVVKDGPDSGSAVNHKTTKTGPVGSFLFKNQARIKV